ncbi:MAG: GAF domain-containing protein [Leptolyngbya sp. BL-A-14]
MKWNAIFQGLLVNWLRDAWISRTELKHYVVAVSTVVVAFSFTLWLNKFTSQPIVFLFFAAIAISSRFGGLKPGIVTTILSVLLCDYFLFPPLYTLTAHTSSDLAQLLEFILVAFILCFAFEQLRAIQRSITDANQRLEQEVQERIAREQRLRQHTQALSELANHPAIAAGDLDSAFDAITEQAANALDVERVSVWLFNGERTKLRCVNLYERSQQRHSSGLEHDQATHPTYFQALAHSRTIAVSDTRTDPLVQELWATWLKPNHIVSLLDAPIRVGGEVVGMVFHEQVHTPRRWELIEQTFVGSISDFVALALEVSQRKQAEAALRASSILEERNRMAREIHDTLAQAFTGIIVQLGNASRLMNTDLAVAQSHIQIGRDLARTGLAEARRSVEALRPRLLEDGDLCTALNQMATQLFSGSQTHITCNLMGEPYPLPTEVESNLLRIGQEAVTNALKYAHASYIQIELIYNSTHCLLRVKDDGRGFAINQAPASNGYGLLGMSERADRMGAQLTIQSAPGQGTEITVVCNRK